MSLNNSDAEFRTGHTKRGRETILFCGHEFWFLRRNNKGEQFWRCCKHEKLHCPARMKTSGAHILKRPGEHNHEGNSASSFAREALHSMKCQMTQPLATPSSAQGSVVASLNDETRMALADKASISRMLRRYRQTQTQRG